MAPLGLAGCFNLGRLVCVVAWAFMAEPSPGQQHGGGVWLIDDKMFSPHIHGELFILGLVPPPVH